MPSVTPNPDVTFKVHFQDEHLLVIEKPPRLVTQPGKGHDTDTLLNGLFAHFGKSLQNLGASRDFGLLHRLDRATSGLLIVGLRASAYDHLLDQFRARAVRKFYWAVCHKAPKGPSGVINRPILETEPRARETKTARISSAGKPAVTAWRTVAESAKAALIEARPLTGRLHQVRVHLDSIGSTILGDDVYGNPALVRLAPRLALHAHRLAFVHPFTGLPVDIHSPFPKDLRHTLTKLGLPRPDLVPAEAKAPDQSPIEMDAGKP
jgi:23S rRNA pseudouridine1911/1915/1917 synthase